MSRRPFVVVTLLSFLGNYALDRLTKHLALLFLRGRAPLSFLKGVVVLVFTENRGAFLSLGSHWPNGIKYLLLLIIPILFCLGLLLYAMFREPALGRAAICGCIVGGGLGNLIDRAFNGFRVIDFLNFGIGGLRTGILNVADLSVTFGVIALLVNELIRSRKRET